MKKVKSPNHTYYRNKADNLFMEPYRGQPCAVCGTDHGTCAHHIVSKGRSKALRYDHRNIIVLCQAHHTMGTDMAPHATSQTAVERFLNWFKETFPFQYEWTKENEFIQRKYTYRQAGENMAKGVRAWK